MDPHLAKERRERADPNPVKAKTDMFAENLVVERTETAEPIFARPITDILSTEPKIAAPMQDTDDPNLA